MSTPAASPSAFGSRPVLSAARAAAAAPPAATAEASRLWALSDAEVGAALDVLHEVRRAAEAQQVAVVVEARSRGQALLQAWALGHRCRPGTRHAATLQAVATACETPGSPTSPRPSSPARCRSARPPSSPASTPPPAASPTPPSSQPTRPSSSPTRRT